jgi:GNAT superfamily N-acetyltransferase
MRIEKVKTLEQAQIVRMIRNEGRAYMTNNTAFISSEDQHRWFLIGDRDNRQLYLYYDNYDSPVGFGYLQVKSNKTWATLAVYKEYHNTGYGTKIYQHLASLSEIWIEIFSDNRSSLVAALKAGFEIQSMNDKIIVLRKDKI